MNILKTRMSPLPAQINARDAKGRENRGAKGEARRGRNLGVDRMNGVL